MAYLPCEEIMRITASGPLRLWTSIAMVSQTTAVATGRGGGRRALGMLNFLFSCLSFVVLVEIHTISVAM